MRREEHRCALLAPQLVEQPEDRTTVSRVQVAGRFVRYQDARPVHERARDRRALLLAAGELARKVPRALAQSDTLEKFPHAPVILTTSERERQTDVLLDAEIRHQVKGLEHHADRFASQPHQESLAGAREVEPAHDDAPAVRDIDSRHEVEQRRLPAARRPDEGNELAGLHAEGCCGERVHALFAAHVGPTHSLEENDGFREFGYHRAVKITRPALFLGTILVLGAAVYVLTQVDEPPSSTLPASSSAAAAIDARIQPDALHLPEASETESERSTTPAPEVETANLALAADSLVRGLVVDEEDRAVTGAAITIDYQPGDDFNILDLSYAHQKIEVGETRTDAEGRFAMVVPPDWPMRVHAHAEGHSSAIVTDVFAGADLTIVLGPSARLLGRITRALDGTPVDGAEVHLFRLGGPTYATVQSDADGGYRLDDVPPGLATLEINTSWLADPEWTSIDLPAGVSVVHDVALAEGAAIFGTVTDARTGAPIAGAEIGSGWFLSRAVRSGPGGEYELRGFGGPGVYEIFVRANGYADSHHEFPWTRMPSERTQLDFALGAAHRARGRVVDPGGRPLAGVYVAAVSDGGPSGAEDWKSARTDAAGCFLLDSLSPDHQHGILLRAEGWANLAYAFPHEEREVEEVDLGTFTLRRPGAIAGVVVGDDDEPFSKLEVELRGTNGDSGLLLGGVQSPPLPRNLNTRSVRTDSSGRFHFGDLAAGRFVVSVQRRLGQSIPQPSIDLAEGERRTDLQIVVPRGQKIWGRVETPAGEPVAGLLVCALAEGAEANPQLEVRCRTEGGGVFELAGLESVKYRLTFDPRSLAGPAVKGCAFTQKAGVMPGEELLVVLAQADTIAGYVLTSDDQPVEAAWVEARLDELQTEWTYCDAQGRFELTVPSGATVRVRALPTVKTDDFWGYEVLNEAPGVDLPSIAAGSTDLVLRMPAH